MKLVRSLAVGAALLVAPRAIAAEPAEPPALLRLMPADAVAGVTVDVARLRAEPLFAEQFAPLFEPRGPFAEPLDALGLRLDQIEAVAAYLPPAPAPNPDDPYPSREPFGAPLVLVRTVGAATAPQRSARQEPVRALPDGRTLALAGSRRSAAALAALGEATAPADGSAAALAEELTDAAPAVLAAFGDVTAVRSAMLAELDFSARREDDWIPAFGFARPGVVDANAYGFAMDLRDGVLNVRLLARAPNDAAADRLVRTAEAAVTIAANVANGLPSAILRRDPGEAAIVSLVAGAARKALASVEVTTVDGAGGGTEPDGAAPRVHVAATADAEVTRAIALLTVGAIREEFDRDRRGRTEEMEDFEDSAEEIAEDAEEVMEEVEEATEEEVLPGGGKGG